jgi:sec-independent protein translocase protein TatC
MSLGDHLRELRTRLLICVGTVLVMLIPAWFLYPWLTDILNEPYCTALRGIDPASDCKFLAINVLDPFALRLKVAGYGALFLAMPVILWQLWRFIAPGLYKKERRYALAFTISSLLLFLMGASIAYWTLSKAVDFLVRVAGPSVDVRSGPQEFFKLSMFMMLAFGVGFLFPVFLVALQMVGVVTPQRLSSWRRQAILLITIIAAGITPSGDPFSMFALAIPMYVFYEASILIGRILGRRKRTRARKADEAEQAERAERKARAAAEREQAAATAAAATAPGTAADTSTGTVVTDPGDEPPDGPAPPAGPTQGDDG